MLRYLAKRLLLVVPTFFGITLVTFFMIRLAPGDPAKLKAQAATQGIESEELSKRVIEETRKLYGLDKPIYVQYGSWLARIVKLDFGESFKDHRPVIDKIAETLPVTLTQNHITLVIAYVVSIPLGVWSSVRQETIRDRLVTLVLFVLYSLPNFWVALLLINYLGGGDYLDFFPIAGLSSDGAETLSWLGRRIDNMWHLVLPVAALTYESFAFLSRFSRANLLEVVRQDYIRTARA
ncbi:MAG: ABC transporter permease, partial [Vicinamibacteria bacterium]